MPTKTVGDQLYAIGQNLGTAGAEVVAPDFKVTGLTGATAGARLVGGTASGAPASGTFVVGDLSVDQTGGLWICTTAGSPGTWTLANRLRAAPCRLPPMW